MYYQIGARDALMKLGFDWRGALGNAVERGAKYVDDTNGIPTSGLGTSWPTRPDQFLNNAKAIGTVAGGVGGAATGYLGSDENSLRNAVLGGAGGALAGRVGGSAVGHAGQRAADVLGQRKHLSGLRNELDVMRNKMPPASAPMPHIPGTMAMPHSMVPQAGATPSLFPGLG